MSYREHIAQIIARAIERERVEIEYERTRAMKRAREYDLIRAHFDERHNTTRN